MTTELLKMALEALSRPRPQNSFYQRACDDADVAKAIRAYLYEQPMQVAKRITAMQALEALDELESSARGDEPFNHSAAPVVRAFIEGVLHPAKPQGEPAPERKPAWHDAPTCDGIWVCKEGETNQFKWHVLVVTDHLEQPLTDDRWPEKWYGPIPQEPAP